MNESGPDRQSQASAARRPEGLLVIVLFTDFGLHGPGGRPAIVLEADGRWYVGPW